MTILAEEIERFEDIAHWAQERGSRVGYFAALYLGITKAIARNMTHLEPDRERPNFDDPHRMVQFVGVFANRYFTAWDGYRIGAKPTSAIGVEGRATEPWRVHFDHCDSERSTIMQILGSGANAHMNFDLPLSAIEVGGPDVDRYQSLKHDYDTIDLILAEQISVGHQQVRDESPLIRIADRFPKTADRLVGKLIWDTRAQAWRNATKLRDELFDTGLLGSVRNPENVRDLERSTAALGRRVVRPPLPLHLILAYVLAPFEPDGPDGVAQVIARLLATDVGDDFVLETLTRPRQHSST